MAGGMTKRWPLDAAWDAATEVTAAAYGVQAQMLRAPSRGRGPRPPAEIWSAKKMAVHLTVVLADCDYSALSRHIALHKDTVASHCAAVRQAVARDFDTGALSEALEGAAHVRLQALGVDCEAPLKRLASPAAQLDALERWMGEILQAARAKLVRTGLHPSHPSSSDNSRKRDQKGLAA